MKRPVGSITATISSGRLRGCSTVRRQRSSENVLASARRRPAEGGAGTNTVVTSWRVTGPLRSPVTTGWPARKNFSSSSRPSGAGGGVPNGTAVLTIWVPVSSTTTVQTCGG